LANLRKVGGRIRIDGLKDGRETGKVPQ
jgi:hypothetical protein